MKKEKEITIRCGHSVPVEEDKEQETVHFPQFPYTAEQLAKAVITPIKKPQATS